jgi:RNA polymerase sigma-70 factor, ECF subfamily
MTDWDSIVDEHGPLVWRAAYRLLGNEADAADCYQEAFAAALQVSRREAVRNWPAMLQKLATTHALDRLRRRLKQAARQDARPDVDKMPSADPGPDRLAQGQELLGRLRGALIELPEMQAQAFWLTGIEEMSYQEAALELGIEPNHLGVLLHRARLRLRELLAPIREDSER